MSGWSSGPRSCCASTAPRRASTGCRRTAVPPELGLPPLPRRAGAVDRRGGGARRRLHSRLSLPVITVAAPQGHTFAAGAMAEDAVRTTAIEVAQARTGKAGDTLAPSRPVCTGPRRLSCATPPRPSADAEGHDDPPRPPSHRRAGGRTLGVGRTRAGQPPAPRCAELSPILGGRPVRARLARWCHLPGRTDGGAHRIRSHVEA